SRRFFQDEAADVVRNRDFQLQRDQPRRSTRVPRCRHPHKGCGMTVQEGLDLGELGMADAIAAATTGYTDHTKIITAAIVQAAATRRFFCADDVRDLLPDATREWLGLSHLGPDGRTKS